jgi:hypothetical protein
MRRSLQFTRLARVTATSIALATAIGMAMADDLPGYMQPIAGHTASRPAETATKNVLALNSSMFELYGDAAKVFEKNILSKHPVILGLFSGAGGRFILYRPGQPPLDAPSVPIAYQLLKSVGHSTMALAEVETMSFTTTPSDMLESLTRIIADRSVGALFFGNYHLMDYELMGGDARAAIIAEDGKREMKPFLPPLVPFGSNQWPTLVTPGPGPATIADLH